MLFPEYNDAASHLICFLKISFSVLLISLNL